MSVPPTCNHVTLKPHSYPEEVTVTVEEQQNNHTAQVVVRNIPEGFYIPIKETVRRFFTAMKELDADRLWNERLGNLDTFFHTAEQALAAVLPLSNPLVDELHAPDGTVENIGAQLAEDSHYDHWLDATALYLSQWFVFATDCYRHYVNDTDLAEVTAEIEAALADCDLPDKVTKFLLRQPLTTEPDTEPDTAATSTDSNGQSDDDQPPTADQLTVTRSDHCK